MPKKPDSAATIELSYAKNLSLGKVVVRMQVYKYGFNAVYSQALERKKH